MATFTIAKNKLLKLPLFADSVAVSPLNAFGNREVIAVGCSSLTGESWHGEICLVNAGDSKDKGTRKPFIQQKIRTYAGNTSVIWLNLPSTTAPTAPLLLSSGDDSCLYIRSVAIAETSDEETGESKSEVSTSLSSSSSSSSSFDSSKKKKKKKKKHKTGSTGSGTSTTLSAEADTKSESDSTPMDTSTGSSTGTSLSNSTSSSSTTGSNSSTTGSGSGPKPPPPQNLPYHVTVVTRLMEHADVVTSVHSTVAAYPYVATSSMDQTLKLWNVEKGGGAAQTFHSSAPAWCGRLSDSEQSLLAGGYQDGRVRVWDARVTSSKTHPQSVLSLSLGAPVYSIVWHPSVSSVFVAGTETGTIYAYDVRQPKASLTTNSDHLASVRSLDFCPWAPKVLASSSDDTSVRILNLDLAVSGGNVSATRFSSWSVYAEHSDYVRGVAWSPQALSREETLKGKKCTGTQGWLFSCAWDYQLCYRRLAVVSESKEGEVYPMAIEEEEEESVRPHASVSLSDDGVDSQIGTERLETSFA